MKQFIIFLFLFIILAAGFIAFSHYYLGWNPKKVVIAVDTSYGMNNSWSQVAETVKAYENMKYSIFSLITDKMTIHSWEKQLQTEKLGNIKPYGPTDISVFNDQNKFTELKKADMIVIITNANDISIFTKDSRYKIIQLK
jgi:DNA polymerase III alpha subunit